MYKREVVGTLTQSELVSAAHNLQVSVRLAADTLHNLQRFAQLETEAAKV
jgi:hypothetical protein